MVTGHPFNQSQACLVFCQVLVQRADQSQMSNVKVIEFSDKRNSKSGIRRVSTTRTRTDVFQQFFRKYAETIIRFD